MTDGRQIGFVSADAKRPGNPSGRPALVSFAGRQRLFFYIKGAADSMSDRWFRSAADIGSGRGGNVSGGSIVTAPFFFNRADRDRLSKLAGMLGSSHDGERAAAAMMATKLLEGVGVSWADLVASVPVKSPPRYLTRPETRRAAIRMSVPS